MTEESDNPKSSPESRMGKLLHGSIDSSIKSKLPRATNAPVNRSADFSSEYRDLIRSLEQETSLDELTLIKQGLIFVALAMRIKNQGLKLAIVDSDGILVANIDGY